MKYLRTIVRVDLQGRLLNVDIKKRRNIIDALFDKKGINAGSVRVLQHINSF